MWSPCVLCHFILHYLLLCCTATRAESGKLTRPFNNSISAVFVFGDSTVDSGNNNYVNTGIKSNFPPYGRNFVNSSPTGRFCDGRLVTDFMASHVGVKEYVPPYLDPSLGLDDLMTGVCFASAGSGFDPLTARLSGVIPVQKQIEYFKEYKAKLEAAIGKERTQTLISEALFLVSASTNDFVITYYGTPLRRTTYDINAYQQFVLQHVQQFIKGLRDEGAQMIVFAGLPPIGCLPIVITFSPGRASGRRRRCIDSLSAVAMDYNQKLQSMLQQMQNSTSAIVYADIYKPMNDVIRNPSEFGFDNVNAGCCGSGLVETIFLCNPGSPVCADSSKYVFFDSVHPTEAAYSNVFQSMRPSIDGVIKNYRL